MRNILVTGAAGFIGSNLTLTLQDKYPEARIMAVDDFRSGNFRNLRGFRGDFVTADVSRIEWSERFKDRVFDAIFHQASITDTTLRDQQLLAHDNIESFRRLLEFAGTARTPIVYASSATTYGAARERVSESAAPAPTSIYGFCKVQLDNLTRDFAKRFGGWRIVGMRYFNVYGPREGHKQASASVIHQLYTQMKAGKRPRVSEGGELRGDFIYVKDAVAQTMQALTAPRSNVYNCGSGQSISLNEIVAELNKHLGTSLEPEPGGDSLNFYHPFTEADMTLAETELHFTPKYTPADGIADYVQILEQSSQ